MIECVNIKSAAEEILKLIGKSDKLFKDFGYNDREKDTYFRQGAYWGMAMAITHILANSPKIYVEEEQLNEDEKFPNRECGSCPGWLAYCAGDCPNGISEMSVLETYCKEQDCRIFGKTRSEVEAEEALHHHKSPITEEDC